MTPLPVAPPARRRGFTLVEVILAVGVIGIAIASLIGILASSFQQVDDIMQTNRALTSAQALVTGLDNPRSILRDLTVAGTGVSTNATSANYLASLTGLDNATADAPNFDLVYNLLKDAHGGTASACVWLYVYERKQTHSASESTATSAGGAQLYNINANPALAEVVYMTGASAGVPGALTPDLARARNIHGTPMRVRLTLSRLLVGQRVTLDATTGEPTAATYLSGSLPAVDNYALAYLPIVAEFYPHDYEAPTVFTDAAYERQPVLVQTIVINR